MAMNMMGALAIQAKDSGAGKTILGITQKLTSLATIAGNVGTSFQNIATGGLNLTTAYEAQFTASNKDATQLAASFGIFGKAQQEFSDKATAMSIKLKMGVGDTAKAMNTFRLAEEQFKNMGVDSAESLAKLVEVSGMSAESFEDAATRMKAWGLTG